MTTTSQSIPGFEFIRTDWQPFLACAQESPEDDAPMLIFADFLDEQGHEKEAGRIRFWIRAWREVLGAVKPAKGKSDFDTLQAASSDLFAKKDRPGVVLAIVAVHRWQERLHPVDWNKFREYHKDVDGLRAQTEMAWLAVEWAGLGLLLLEAIDAAWRSADAAGSSADAAWRSAYAKAQEKLMRIAIAVFKSPIWMDMP